MRFRRRIRGQALLEFGLILPMLVLILVLFLEFGRIVYYYVALNHAVREGARWAIVRSDAGVQEIRDRVVQSAISMPLAGSDVTVGCIPVSALPCGDQITVLGHVAIAPMVPLVAQVFGAGTVYDLNAKSTMQMTPCGAQPAACPTQGP